VWRLTLAAARRRCWQSTPYWWWAASSWLLRPRLGLVSSQWYCSTSRTVVVLDLLKMDVPLIGWELTGVPDFGWRLAGCTSGAVAESPLSPLHPALLQEVLNAYLGWTLDNFCAFYWHFSLCLEGNWWGTSHSGKVLLVDPTGICRFCKDKRSLLPISIWTK